MGLFEVMSVRDSRSTELKWLGPILFGLSLFLASNWWGWWAAALVLVVGVGQLIDGYWIGVKRKARTTEKFVIK